MNLLKPNPFITTAIQLSLPLSIYLGIQSGAEWYWWLIAFFFYTVVYTLIGNNIGYHRYFTHKHFEVSPPVRYLFLWAGSVSGIGDPISYSTTHLVHHKYQDTDMDPHGPVRGIKSIMFYFYKTVTAIPGRRVIELIKDYSWLHSYYVPFVVLNAVIMYLISYKVFLFCWLIPSSLFLWGLGIGVLAQHWGYKARNFKTIDLTIPWYEGLHDNHHAAPSAPNTAFNKGEIDWSYQFSRIFKPSYDWRGQPDAKTPSS